MLLGQHHVFGLHGSLEPTEWIRFLAGFGSILLTFIAGAEIEPSILRRYFKESLAIGTASFAAAVRRRHALCPLRQWLGLARGDNLRHRLSTTSVAVVYAVMIETGLNETDFGKLLLAACFVTDLGTVVALELASPTTIGVCWSSRSSPRSCSGWRLGSCSGSSCAFRRTSANRASRWSSSYCSAWRHLPRFPTARPCSRLIWSAWHWPEFLLISETLFVGLCTTVFAFLTPFYFLNAGMKVNAVAVGASLVLIVILLAVKLITKTIGVWPLTRLFRFGFRESAYTTLLMSTGLTFGTISALFGLTHGYTDPSGTFHTYINQEQYSILVTVVIGSAILPTLIAQKFFRPEIEPVVAVEVWPRAPVWPAPAPMARW